MPPAKRKKTWREKPADDKDLPPIAKIEGKLSKRWGEGAFVIFDASSWDLPAHYDH